MAARKKQTTKKKVAKKRKKQVSSKTKTKQKSAEPEQCTNAQLILAIGDKVRKTAEDIETEVESIISWAEEDKDSKPTEDVHAALTRAIEQASIAWTSARLSQVLEQIRESGSCSRTAGVLAEVLLQDLIHQHVGAIEKISRAIIEARLRVPRNVYNVAEALDNFARQLDPFDPGLLNTACSTLAYSINPTQGNVLGTLYTPEDIEAARQEGFEEGYERALRRSSGSGQPQRIRDLDL